MNSKSYIATSDTEWNYPSYPGDPSPPRGVKLQLLTRGGISVYGVWKDGGDFLAWAPLIKRNKEKEAYLNGQAR